MIDLVFLPDDETSRWSAGLVEIVEEFKAAQPNRMFLVRYLDPWLGDKPVLAFGDELEVRPERLSHD